MKRFSETEKWRDPWFRALPAPAKLLFFYFVDNCNNAGFHELDVELMVMLTAMKAEHCEGALKALKRGIIGPFEGWYWVRRFLRHQKNEPLNPDNPAHKQIILMLTEQMERFKSSPEFQEFIGPYKGLLCPLGKGIGKGKEREIPKREREFALEMPPLKKNSAERLDFLDQLKALDVYKGIDIDREIGHMRAWLLTPKGRGRKLTKSFVVAWLNKADAPLIGGNGEKSIEEQNYEYRLKKERREREEEERLKSRGNK